MHKIAKKPLFFAYYYRNITVVKWASGHESG